MIGDKVMVEKVEEKPGKIFIPTAAMKERFRQGVVVSLGPGKVNKKGKLVPIGVKKGETVLFEKYGPEEILIEGKMYSILSESSILAVIG